MLEATNLSSFLKDPSLLCSQAFVAGEWVDADDATTFAVTNPSRGDILIEVPDLGVAETRRAIESARIAQKEWAQRTGK